MASATPVEALKSAQAVLRLAEQRLGVRSQGELIEPVPPAANQPLTAALLPEGVLPRGSVVSVLGSASLTAWLLGASQGDSWVAIVGWPSLHAGALAEAGVELERVVVVPDVGGSCWSAPRSRPLCSTSVVDLICCICNAQALLMQLVGRDHDRAKLRL